VPRLGLLLIKKPQKKLKKEAPLKGKTISPHAIMVSDVLEKHTLPAAQRLDAEDPLQHIRSEFRIPSKSDLKLEALPAQGLIPTPTSLPRMTFHAGTVG
jgi:hypothetical protein